MDASFFNGDEMQALRHSLYFKVDKDTPLRENILDYVNTSTYNPQDAFFFDMIPAIRFLYTDPDSVAYTDRDSLIWLNPPKHYQKVEEWDFIFYHECLHQLWDTFGVEDEIIKQGIKFDHYLLNIASDCVINDFLAFIRKKKEPAGLINPKYIKDKYGVLYNRYNDDQITLYKKILEAKEKNNIKDDPQYSESGEGKGENQSGQGDDKGQNSPQNQQGNQGNQGNQQGNKGNQGNQGNQQGNQGDQQGDQQGGQGNQQGNKQGGQGNQQGGQQGNQGNQQGDQQHSGSGAALDDVKGSPNKGQFSGGKLAGDTDKGFSYDPKYDKMAKEYVKGIIKQYSNSLTGAIGDFMSKCKNAKAHISDLKNRDNGVTMRTSAGGSRNWNKQFNSTIDKYVYQRVQQASTKFKKTWTKLKRGSGPIQFGQPLSQGRMRERDGISITMGFYVDTSGSMGGDPIENCCKAVNYLAQDIDKKYIKNPMVKGTDYRAYSFDEKFHEEKMPMKIPARDMGNIDLDELIKGMKDKTQTSMVNVVLTDAGFPVIPSVCIPLIKSFPGLFVFVINGPMYEDKYKEIESKCNNFKYIQADEEFTI